jgi:hypothetical protein
MTKEYPILRKSIMGKMGILHQGKWEGKTKIYPLGRKKN